MSWHSSSRRSQLPPNWRELRREVLDDAHWICEIQLTGRCLGTASEVDHIERGNDHSRGNLRAACYVCHLIKSSHEGVAARKRKQAQRKRPVERHPGHN